MSLSRILLTVGCLATIGLPAVANPLSGAMKAMGTEVDTAAAYQTKLSEADAAWTAMPMSAQKTLLVVYDSSGYGDYDPRPNAEFKDSEKVFSYVEPIGYVFKDIGGLYSFGYTIDLKVKRADGSVLFQKEKYAAVNAKSRAKKYESSFASALGIGGLDAGTYTIEFAFHDLNSDKTMDVTQTFKIVK